MKKFGKLLLCFMLLFSLTAVVVGCHQDEKPVETPEEQRAKAVESALKALDTKYSKVELDAYEQEDVDQINAIYETGKALIKASTSAEEAAQNRQAALAALEEYLNQLVKLGNGVYSFVASSYADRTKILGLLEKYAVDNGLTGITVFEDSGYILYDESVVKGTENYIPGYGFGILSEGAITADLSGETNAAWKRYYHTYETSDPKNLNYGDDQGSVVGDLAGYIFDSYWGTKMNETKDGYVWYNSLANEKPQPQNTSSVTGLATIYKFEVKIGSQLKYSTNSTKLAKYNGREVQIEDYLTPFKLLHTKANGWARAAENLTDASAIKGMNKFYKATASGYSDVAWANVGLKAEVVDGKGYITVEFNQPCTPFFAMYYLNSSLYSPIPQEFIDEIGGPDYFAKFDVENGLTPVDTTLATGPYVLETWEEDKAIVFGKNANYHNTELYQGVPGVHVAILEAASEQVEAAYNEFVAGKLTSVGIPSTKLKELKNDPRAKQTVGSTTTKLNINTCTQEEWEYLFGVNGTVTQTEKEDYWECEPALSNENFVKGLSYAIDRVKFAEEVGRTPSVSYFGAAYMANPEEGILYNNTEEHKNAIAGLLKGTDGYGYSLELARQYFKTACEELLASGAYKEGDTISIEMAWQGQANVDVYQKPIENFWLTAFNHESVCGGKLTLEITSYVPNKWSDVYYKKMMVGQFDIGFGGISGNALNPLNFFEVLKSDNSSGFTLNWGPNTNEVSDQLIFDDMAWSFDALWQAADTGGYFEKGVNCAIYKPELVENGATVNEDGSATFVYKANVVTNKYEFESNVLSIDLAEVNMFSYFFIDASGKRLKYSDVVSGAAKYADVEYDEASVEFTYDKETDTITVTISAELYEEYSEAYVDYAFGFDFCFETVIQDINSSPIYSSYEAFPYAYEDAE